MLIDSLLGVHIVNIHVATGENGTINTADFIYELSDGRYIRLPDCYVSVLEVENCQLAPGFHPVSNQWRHQHHPNLFGRPIVDILVPRDPARRTEDNTALQLDSGYFLLQESSAPQGILPDIYLVDTIDSSEMQSVFETDDWVAFKSLPRRAATQPNHGPEPPASEAS